MVKCTLFAAWIIAFSCSKPLKILFACIPDERIRSDHRHLAKNKAAASDIRNLNRFVISLRLRGGGEEKEAGSLASPVLREHFTRGHFHPGSSEAMAKQIGATSPSGEKETKILDKRSSRKTSDSDMDMENQPWFHLAANDEGRFRFQFSKQEIIYSPCLRWHVPSFSRLAVSRYPVPRT